MHASRRICERRAFRTAFTFSVLLCLATHGLSLNTAQSGHYATASAFRNLNQWSELESLERTVARTRAKGSMLHNPPETKARHEADANKASSDFLDIDEESPETRRQIEGIYLQTRKRSAQHDSSDENKDIDPDGEVADI